MNRTPRIVRAYPMPKRVWVASLPQRMDTVDLTPLVRLTERLKRDVTPVTSQPVTEPTVTAHRHSFSSRGRVEWLRVGFINGSKTSVVMRSVRLCDGCGTRDRRRA